MAKLVGKAVLYIVLMNAVLFLGARAAGRAFAFDFVFNVAAPIICAFAAWEVEQKKAGKEAPY